MKYVLPKGSKPNLFYPAGTQSIITQPKVPLIVTEGAKKALSAEAHGFNAVSVHGCWNWMSEGLPIDDLSRIAWNQREIYLAFDSDALQKSEVNRALFRLGIELERRKAFVRLLLFPSDEAVGKVGLDDYLVVHRSSGLKGLLANAVTLEKYQANRLQSLPKHQRSVELDILLKEIARHCTHARAHDFVVESAFALDISTGALERDLREHRKQHRILDIDPCAESLDRIRGTQHETNRMLSTHIIEDLMRKGVLLNSDRGVFYFSREKKHVYEIGDAGFQALCHQNYGTNSSETEWKFLCSEIAHKAHATCKCIQVHYNWFFDSAKRVLYIVDRDGMMIRLNGKSESLVEVGTNDVFIKPMGFEPPNAVVGAGADWNSLVYDLLSLNTRWGLSRPHVRLLLRVWTLAMFFREILPTCPILSITGPKASGKTMATKGIGRAIFGTSFDVHNMPSKHDDLETLLISSSYVALDNNDAHNPDPILNLLAVAATGGQITRRLLYTTAQEAHYRLRSHIAMTSRTPKYARDDIADRSIAIGASPLDDCVDEYILVKRILNRRAALWLSLRSYLNATIRRLRNKSTFVRITNFRMADFANFGFVALSKEEHDAWREAIGLLRGTQQQLQLNEDEMALSLLKWLFDLPAQKLKDITVEWLVDTMGVADELRKRGEATKIGKRFKNSRDPIHLWFKISARSLRGKSVYSISFTSEGRMAAASGGGLGGPTPLLSSNKKNSRDPKAVLKNRGARKSIKSTKKCAKSVKVRKD